MPPSNRQPAAITHVRRSSYRSTAQPMTTAAMALTRPFA